MRENIIVLQSDYDTTPRRLTILPLGFYDRIPAVLPRDSLHRYKIPLYSHRYERVCMYVCIFTRLNLLTSHEEHGAVPVVHP